MTSRELAPEDAELVAAFIDKKLSKDERQAFLERLDKDEALYEVFVETVRYRDQAGADGGKVLGTSVWGRKWTVLSAVAALIAVAVATPVFFGRFSEESYAEALVADGRLEPYLEEGWYEKPWSVLRGTVPDMSETDAAFRVGVFAADLDVALRSGRRNDAMVLCRRIETLLQEIEFSEPLRALVSELRTGLETANGQEVLELQIPTNSTFEEHLGALANDYGFGKWAETGRLAAQSANADVLASTRFRRDFQLLKVFEGDNEVGRTLESIAKTLSSSTRAWHFSKLEELFCTIIKDN